MPAPKMERTLDLQDDLLLARLKRSEKTSVRLEADSFYLPLPVQEDRGHNIGSLLLQEFFGIHLIYPLTFS